MEMKEEGLQLQALFEEEKEVELKGQKEMQEQGNWMFDLAEENWEVMVVWKQWKNLLEKLKK